MTDAHAACSGKFKYGTRPQAIRVAEKAKKNVRASYLTTYKCANCGGWHIGNMFAPKRVKESA